MKKILIVSTDVINDLEDSLKLMEFFDKEIINDNKIIFTSRDERKLEILKTKLSEKNYKFIHRDKIIKRLKEKKDFSNYFIVIGNREADMFMASSNKLFYIVPKWCKKFDEKAIRYGIKVSTVGKLEKLINIIHNQNSWFYRLDLDEKTTILSLTSANTYGTHSDEEIKMINGFRNFLKKGNKSYYEVLLYHFLAAISNKAEFRDIKDWGIFPSSSTELNNDMWIFKEKARELMNGRKKEPIFIRHTPTWKSHESKKLGKDRLPCDRHFNTIIVHEKYRNKLRGRTVCIFDDYLDNGTSFEASRNLLLKEGVEKIFFVSLGRFYRFRTTDQYCQQNYLIDGNLYKEGYKYKLLDCNWHEGEFDYKAVDEIENLHDIIFK